MVMISRLIDKTPCVVPNQKTPAVSAAEPKIPVQPPHMHVIHVLDEKLFEGIAQA